MSLACCRICGAQTSRALIGRSDREFGVKHQLEYHRCKICGLTFADPVPIELVPSFYAEYSSHFESTEGFFSRLQERKMMSEMDLGDPNGAILDYGCGNGRFLVTLSRYGYTNASGYDFDPAARAATRRAGQTVYDSLPDGPFDVITLNHVLEHLANPAIEMTSLAERLSPGGRIILRTPNSKSMMARLTGDDWRGWETPRHLNVFSPPSIRLLFQTEGLRHLNVKLRTSRAMFFGIFHESLNGARWQTRLGKIARHAAALALYQIAWLNGEELVVCARAPKISR